MTRRRVRRALPQARCEAGPQAPVADRARRPPNLGGGRDLRRRQRQLPVRSGAAAAPDRRRPERADRRPEEHARQQGQAHPRCPADRADGARVLPTGTVRIKPDGLDVDGFIVDGRTMPPEIQAEARRRGLIPDLPSVGDKADRVDRRRGTLMTTGRAARAAKPRRIRPQGRRVPRVGAGLPGRGRRSRGPGAGGIQRPGKDQSWGEGPVDETFIGEHVPRLAPSSPWNDTVGHRRPNGGPQS